MNDRWRTTAPVPSVGVTEYKVEATLDYLVRQAPLTPRFWHAAPERPLWIRSAQVKLPRNRRPSPSRLVSYRC